MLLCLVDYGQLINCSGNKEPVACQEVLGTPEHCHNTRVGETRGEDTQRLLPEELLMDPIRITVLILWSLKLTFKRTS